MGFRYSVLCETPSNAVDAVRSASPLGVQIENIKIEEIPKKDAHHIFNLKRSI
jgi:hypothetical protein